MRVDLSDEFYVETDALNYILYKKYKSEREKTKGKDCTTVLGYYRNLKDVAKAMIDCRFNCDTKSLGVSLDNMATILGEVYQKACTDLLEQFKRVLDDKPEGWNDFKIDDVPFSEG